MRILLACTLALGLLSNAAWGGTPVLTGSVHRSQQLPPERTLEEYGGTVISESQPLAGVTVYIPALGYQTFSRADGRFALPALPEQPVIVSFSKRGFVPETVTLQIDQLRRSGGLTVRLRQSRTILVLEDQWQHLGDNSYSPASSGAMHFRRAARSPRYLRMFHLDTLPQTGAAVLEIGSVIGLDTAEAHQMGQSRFHRVSTPMSVYINGQLAGQIGINGDRRQVYIPARMLRAGRNTLEIETGHQINTSGATDYDDMEWMLLTLDLDGQSRLSEDFLQDPLAEVYNRSR